VFLDRVYDSVTGAYVPAFVLSRRAIMDPRSFEREIGRWNAEQERFIPQFHAISGIAHYNFDRSTHVQSWDERHAVLERLFGLYPGLGIDITERVTRSRFGVPYNWVVGLDWGVKPMVANIWKIVQPPPGASEIAWCVGEIVIDHTKAGPIPMMEEMDRRKYTPSTTVVIADASDQYASSNYILMRRGLSGVDGTGWQCVKPSKKGGNPRQRDRINAVCAKLKSESRHTTLFIDGRRAPKTAEAFARQRLDDRGRPEHDRYSHFTAAGGYVIVKLWPSGSDAEHLPTMRVA